MCLPAPSKWQLYAKYSLKNYKKVSIIKLYFNFIVDISAEIRYNKFCQSSVLESTTNDCNNVGA